MSYASALKSGVAGGNSTRPRPIARPAPIAPPATSQGAGDPVKNAGPFGTLLPAAIIKIAVYAGPSGLCNLGVCSKFLRDQVLLPSSQTFSVSLCHLYACFVRQRPLFVHLPFRLFLLFLL